MDLFKCLCNIDYRNPCSILFVSAIIILLIGISLITNFIIIPGILLTILGVLLIIIFYIVKKHLYNELPVVKGNKNAGILIRIFAKDEEEYDDLKYKFLNEFTYVLANEKTKHFKTICIPFHLIDEYSSNNEGDIIKLLEKTNCVSLITVRTKSEQLDLTTQYVTEFTLGIMHPHYIKNLNNLLQQEINKLLSKTSKFKYLKENKMQVLETMGQNSSFICQYIITKSFFLNGQINDAKNMGTDLYEKIKNFSSKEITNTLINLTKNLCYNIHLFSLFIEFSKIELNLNEIGKELNEMNNYIPNTYDYYEGMCVYTFLKHRDITKVKEYINKCKQLNGPKTWKYNEAFLYAYMEKSEGQIISKYIQAFKIPYNHSELVYFIENIYDKEKKNTLAFALAILYIALEQKELAILFLHEYLNNKPSHSLEEDTFKKLSKKFDKKLVNSIYKQASLNKKEERM